MTFMLLIYITSCCGECNDNKNEKRNEKSIVSEYHKYKLPTENYLYCIETYVIDGYKFYVFCINGEIEVIPEAMCKDKSETSSSNSWLY